MTLNFKLESFNYSTFFMFSFYFFLSVIINKERIQCINFGLIKLLENDFLNCIHILVFQIEGILRDIVIKIGEPPQKVKPDSEEFYSFGQIINRIREVKSDNEDILELLRFIETFLVDKRAANIRNLIAHGYYPYKANNIGYAILLVFILLKLSNLSVGMK